MAVGDIAGKAAVVERGHPAGPAASPVVCWFSGHAYSELCFFRESMCVFHSARPSLGISDSLSDPASVDVAPIRSCPAKHPGWTFRKPALRHRNKVTGAFVVRPDHEKSDSRVSRMVRGSGTVP